MSGGSEKELGALLEKACRRYWSRYLSIDVVSPGEVGKDASVRSIESKGAPVDPADMWMPEPEAVQRVAGQRTFVLSEIRRVRLRRTDPESSEITERWEPVVWACASLPRTDVEGKAPAPFIRVLMSLHAAASPRHLFALIGPDGQWLVKPEEFVEAGQPINDGLIQAISRNPEVREGLLPLRQRPGAETEGAARREEPQVERIKLFEYQPLQAPYWFLEGLPGDRLLRALEEAPESEVSALFERIRDRTESDGRIGGVGGGGRELRLLAPDRERLERLRTALTDGLTERYGADITRISWRKPVVCDEAHAWTIRLGIDGVDQQPGYLIVYAVLDDELASSIQQEMEMLRQFSFVIAFLAGMIAFMISLFFVRPLQRMTQTAQRVSEADPERLPAQLRRLVDHLPVQRGDEVGDIARASKRLFEEVLESQQKLEHRVEERTAKLAEANRELEHANEQLTSLSREKDAFVAKVSHDLRQPLNAIFLQVEALKLTRLDDQQTRDVKRI
ncbi:MAG: HAMP domain-containing protein, partial [Verrucomicrobiae bacterium]|nr:HAMP domain-containing protein [Verrucomicrobiae bacterium]